MVRTKGGEGVGEGEERGGGGERGEGDGERKKRWREGAETRLVRDSALLVI